MKLDELACDVYEKTNDMSWCLRHEVRRIDGKVRNEFGRRGCRPVQVVDRVEERVDGWVRPGTD
jgi:hypothetical protein